MDLPRRYAYKPKWGAIIIGAVFFGACAVIMVYQATHNEGGLTLNGIITLDPNGATAFYWVIAVLAGSFVLAAFVLVVRRIGNPIVLELKADGLILPIGLFQSRVSTIPYATIEQVSEVRLYGQTLLYIWANGQRYTITASLLPDKHTYQAIREFLATQGR